jgi:hypothetical protein
VNIFVLANNYETFQGFLHDYRCRQHFGDGNRMGQVRYLHDSDQLRGTSSALVLVWGSPLTGLARETQLEAECMPQVVVCRVPMSEREKTARAEYARKLGGL